jgi:hypothetical protein
MFEYFYHEILRKTVIGFGTLFNEIYIKKKDSDGNITSSFKVPLAYGPTQKFLARIQQQPDLNRADLVTLPRMSFEFVGLNYDSSRKLTTTQTFLSASKTNSQDIRKAYMPVPYNMDFELSILGKLNDDMLQIIEQILPYFQPNYNLTIDLVDTIGEKKDIPVTLDNITMQDDYEGDYSTRRALIYTLKFTAKTYLFGPVQTGASSDIIKKVSIGFVAGDSTRSPVRDLTYSAEPTATKSYLNTVASVLTKDIDIGDVSIEVLDSTSIVEKSHIVIGEETLLVNKKEGNSISVTRGVYNTKIANHVSGSEVKLITEQDNQLIELGDDFGFNGGF